MASSSIRAVAVPRFLLPQLTWSSLAARQINPARVLLTPRYHSTQSPSKPPRTPIQQKIALQWRKGQAIDLAVGPGIGNQRSFSATSQQARDHHFDTLKFVQRLKDEGFTEEQAEAMMRVLSDVIEERSAYLIIAREAQLTTNPAFKT